MTKSKKQEEPEEEAVIMERMKQGLKRLLDTPPETHKEMVERRRGKRAVSKRREVVHASDCAMHNAPAYEAGACTCGAEPKARR